MTEARLRPAAQRDLAEIWDYTRERWDADQADAYVREIAVALARIAEDPRRGRPCDEIREGYRRYGIASHHIFFVARSDGVDVIRILHQRMDPDRHV